MPTFLIGNGEPHKSMTGGSQVELFDGWVHCGVREVRVAQSENSAPHGPSGPRQVEQREVRRPWPTIPAGGSVEGVAGGSKREVRPSEAGQLRAPSGGELS